MSTTDDAYSESETEARREATLKQILSTPPKPHRPLGKRKGGKATDRT